MKHGIGQQVGNNMKLLRFIRYTSLSILFIIGTVYPLYAQPASAIQVVDCDISFYQNNEVLFYNPCDSADECSDDPLITIKGNYDYAGSPIFNATQMSAIQTNRPFYESAATTHDIPWQMLAAVHMREYNLQKAGPENGDGPYQVVGGGYPVGQYTDEQFQDATDKAAAFIKGKAGARNLTDFNSIKYTFFAYNGTADAYINQAINLGFTESQAINGEGSPYVMNRYDKKRDPSVDPVKSNSSWGQIKTDGGSIEYPANTSHYGAFVYFSALSFEDCEVGFSTDAKALQKIFTDDMVRSGGNSYGYFLGKNGCTTITAWFINKYTTLTYGHGNGEGVVRNLVARNKGKVKESTTPTPLALFSVAGYSRGQWGASGNQYGHTGLVLSVDEQKKEAVTLHTWSGMQGQSPKAYITTFKYPNSRVTFVNVSDYMKSGVNLQ